MTETTALVVVVDTVVIGQLDRGLFRLRAVADEGEGELAVNEASFTMACSTRMGKFSANDGQGAQPTRPHPGGQFAARLKRRKNRTRGRK